MCLLFELKQCQLETLLICGLHPQGSCAEPTSTGHEIRVWQASRAMGGVCQLQAPLSVRMQVQRSFQDLHERTGPEVNTAAFALLATVIFWLQWLHSVFSIYFLLSFSSQHFFLALFHFLFFFNLY